MKTAGGPNFHALETLLYTHFQKIDAIYIDPPYNTRDTDWKYNNNYVDSNDSYGHSMWLAMMQRRLLLAEQLLNPEDSVLIVTIDEKEYLHLGMLLEQTFKEARIQMISDQINPANVSRKGAFGRSDEYIFFVMLGAAAPRATRLGQDWVSEKGRTFTGSVRWDLLRRSGTNARRIDRHKLFYPIYIDPKKKCIVGTGPFLELGQNRHAVPVPKGQAVVWPIRKDRSEGNWQLGQTALMKHVTQGRVRLGGSLERGFVVYYIKIGEYKKVLSGEYPEVGRKADGSLDLGETEEIGNLTVPGTQWRVASHDSTQYGKRLLQSFLPDREFPFPKSLYGVEDALRFFLGDKPNATVLDFFAGSGTTAHAVMRLNSFDEGERQCILITNNEVSAEESETLLTDGHRPGDPEWEALGICEHITKPRLTAAVTGLSPAGVPLEGEYKFSDEFPFSDGFLENVEFFELTYEDPNLIAAKRRFEALAPIFWLKAGGIGAQITRPVADWVLPDDAVYGVLFNTDKWREFADAVLKRGDDIKHIYVRTEASAVNQLMSSELASGLDTTPLYQDYLNTFEENTKGRT